MIDIRVICDTGKRWTTRVNGTYSEAVTYFMGQVFTDEDPETGEETRHTVTKVGEASLWNCQSCYPKLCHCEATQS